MISSSELPAPRLELRWTKTGDTWDERKCAYNLVLPLREHDIRREREDGTTRDCLTVEMGRTKVTGGSRYLFQPNERPGYRIDVPFRDGAHAQWDAEILDLPVYAVFEDYAEYVSSAPQAAPDPPPGCPEGETQ